MLLALPGICMATEIMPKSLTNLVEDADHAIIGTVERIDMVDEKGNEVADDDAGTGPGLKNTIRLHVSVQTNGVLYTTAKVVPKKLTISLWSAWHYRLGKIKKTKGGVAIFLLKGDTFQYVYPSLFRRPISEREQIEQLVKKKKESPSWTSRQPDQRGRRQLVLQARTRELLLGRANWEDAPDTGDRFIESHPTPNSSVRGI